MSHHLADRTWLVELSGRLGKKLDDKLRKSLRDLEDDHTFKSDFTNMMFAPTIVGTMRVSADIPGDTRAFGFLSAKAFDSRQLPADNPPERRELWFVFKTAEVNPVSFGTILGEHPMGAYWNRLPAGGGGARPTYNGAPVDRVRFRPISLDAHNMSLLDFFLAVSSAIPTSAYKLVDAKVSVSEGSWDVGATANPIVSTRIEECFPQGYGSSDHEYGAHLMARAEEDGTGFVTPTRAYTSLYLWRNALFQEAAHTPKWVQRSDYADIPKNGHAFVQEVDWHKWAVLRLGGEEQEAGGSKAVCDVRVYEGQQLEDYVTHVNTNNNLPDWEQP